MATDLEQLQVTLSAKADKFKQEMQDAVREFDKDANQIEQRNRQLTQRMSKSMEDSAASTRFLSSALKQLVSAYAFQQLIDGAIKANEQIAQMARTADLARVSVERFQQIQFAAKTLGGADPADVQKAAHDLALTVNKEVREGEGELTNILKANNMSLTDRNGKAKDFNQLLEMAATLLQRAKTEAQAIDIGRLFNLSEDMVRALEKGPAAFKRAQEAAKDAGAVFDRELVEKAKDFDKMWNETWSKFPTYAKAAAIEAISALTPLGTWLQNLFSRLPGMASAVKHAAGYGDQSLEEAQDTLDQTLKLNPGGTRAIAEATKLRDEAAERQARRVLAERLRQQEAEAVKNRGVAGTEQFGPNLPDLNDPKRGKESAGKDDELDREEKRIQKQINALKGKAAAQEEVGEAIGYAEAKTRLLEAAEAAGRGTTAADKLAIERLAEAYGKYTNALKVANLEKDIFFEREQIGRTPEEQAIAVRTRGLGADDAKKLGDEMRKNQNLLEGKEMAGSFVKGLVSDLENGVKAGQALENQLKRIAEKLADKAIDSLISGVFGGLGKGLFGGIGVPAQAGGGWAGQGPLVNVPASAFIGARHFAAGGGIPAILHAGEIVLNQAQQKNVAQGLGPGKTITITHAPTINGAGMTPDQVFAFVQRSQKEFARNIGPVLNDWQRRHG